uniref:Uncharacterized protein n=1 Tax=Clastoptera arizonana TaxID=38151 RepID=A0A1B6EGE3_9HEMI
MSEIKNNLGGENVIDENDVKCNDEISHFQPGGELDKHSRLERGGRELNLENEPCERKKKTRRGKPKRKNPYNKEVNDIRGKSSNRQKNVSRYAQRQPDAPYNTNQFLMEDHGDVQNIDEKLNIAPASSSIDVNQRPPRVRDPSFTSADSDDFYSSPEDEEEFLTKEFSNTYKDLHVESLGSMTKSELIQQVLQLEEKLDMVEKRIGIKSKHDEKHSGRNNVYNEENDVVYDEKIKQFQQEISRLVLEKEKLQIENDRLRRRNRSSSVSSVDSESDSSTSSPSSVSDFSDREELMCSHDESNVEQEVETAMVGESNGENEVTMIESESFT